MYKIVEVLKNDGNSVEYIAEYKNGDRMTNRMTIEAYNQKIIFDQMMEKYGISEEDMDLIENAVCDRLNRDLDDTEGDF